MMPCQRCSAKDESGRLLPFDKDGKVLKGLKQAKRTKLENVTVIDPSREHDQTATYLNARGTRIYRCQDCGALWRLTYNAVTKEVRENEPVFQLIQGGNGAQQEGSDRDA